MAWSAIYSRSCRRWRARYKLILYDCRIAGIEHLNICKGSIETARVRVTSDLDHPVANRGQPPLRSLDSERIGHLIEHQAHCFVKIDEGLTVAGQLSVDLERSLLFDTLHEGAHILGGLSALCFLDP